METIRDAQEYQTAKETRRRLYAALYSSAGLPANILAPIHTRIGEVERAIKDYEQGQ